MSEVSLFKYLKEGDINTCHQYLDRALLGGEDLVRYLNTLLYYAVSINWGNDIKDHPIIVINAIKNIIADSRDSPSKVLLEYGLNILIGEKVRDDNNYLRDIDTSGAPSTVFVGSLEDAIQDNDWGKAKILTAKIFLASNQSRAVIDTIADLGLQDIESNALFIFHILRAFHFKQKKSQVWAYACCLINVLKSASLPGPHNKKDIDPVKIIDSIQSHNDPELLLTFAAVSRIWNEEYVRGRSYKREISHWLYKIKPSIKKNNIDRSEVLIDQSVEYNNYINIAERIISKESSSDNISKRIVILEAIRYFANTKPNKNLYYYINQIKKS